MGECLPGYIDYLSLMYGQDADIIIAQAGEGIILQDKTTLENKSIRWIKSKQGTQQGDPIGMTMYACGQRKVLQATIDFKNNLVEKWKREHGYNTLKGREADDWLIIAYADDLAIVAPPCRFRIHPSTTKIHRLWLYNGGRTSSSGGRGDRNSHNSGSTWFKCLFVATCSERQTQIYIPN